MPTIKVRKQYGTHSHALDEQTVHCLCIENLQLELLDESSLDDTGERRDLQNFVSRVPGIATTSFSLEGEFK